MNQAKPAQVEKEAGEIIHRTIRMAMPASAWQACGSVARHVRDIHNSAVWLARTALGCFEKAAGSKAWTLKAEDRRPPGWREALDAFDAAIEQINLDRQAKAEGETPKLLTPLGKGLNPNPLATVLDPTLFHKACRDRIDGLDPQKQTAASRIPSVLGKAARERVRCSFSTWAKALGAWKAAGSDPQAMPGMPGYFPKGELPSFEFPLETTRKLPSLEAFEMRVGEDKALALAHDAKAGWNGFELRKHVERSLAAWAKARGLDGAVAKRVRIVVDKNGKASSQVVVELPRSFPEGSFLAELKKREPEAWAKRAGDPATLEAWAKELCAVQSWLPLEVGPEARTGWISQKYGVVGADPGEANLLSLGFSSGQPMAVFTGHEFHKRTARLDQSIDRLASKLCSPEERALQAKRDALAAMGQKLPPSELTRLRELAKARWSDPRILALRRKKRDYVRGEAHRLAAKAAKLASLAGAAVFVLSRNHGLKNASGRSSKQERKSHNIPHGLLAQLLRDKLESLGIALVETEESFTSLASFVDHDPLGVHPQGAKQEKAKAWRAKRKLAQAATPAIPSEQIEETDEKKDEKEKNSAELSAKVFKSPSGARRSSERHWLLRGGPFKPAAFFGAQSIANPHRRRKVHADGQAALNAIRKVSPKFGCSPKVNLGHVLWSLSSGCWREMRV